MPCLATNRVLSEKTETFSDTCHASLCVQQEARHWSENLVSYRGKGRRRVGSLEPFSRPPRNPCGPAWSATQSPDCVQHLAVYRDGLEETAAIRLQLSAH